MAIDLPDVVQEWTANVAAYLAAMEEAAAAARNAAEAALEAAAAVKTLQGVINDLHGKNIDIGLDAGGAQSATAAMDNLTGATNELSGAEAVLGHELSDISADLMMQTASLRSVDESMQAMRRDTADASADLMMQTAILREMRDALLGAAGAATVYNVSIREAAAATNGANNGWAVGIGAMRLTAAALHWIVAGTAEFLAVAIPATIAFGAGLAVAAQGAQMAYIHMSALYSTMEAIGPALGKTTGDVLGLGHALQTAQSAANPGVYEILGSALNDAKARLGDFANAGLQVVHMWDEFSARITVDLQGALGGQIHGLLENMVSDLQKFGQVLGNVGHALLNLASDMPGLAQVLLNVLDFFSKLLLVLTEIPGPIITVAMGLEEFYRWGGLVAQLLVRMTGQMGLFNALLPEGAGFILKFGTAIQALMIGGASLLIWAGQMIGRFAGVSTAFGTMGTAVTEAGASLGNFANNVTPKMIAGFAAVAAVVVLVGVELDKVRNASQQYIDATNKAVSQAPTMVAALNDLSVGYAGVTAKIQEQQRALSSYNGVQQGVGNAIGSFTTGLEHLNGSLGGAATGLTNIWASQARWMDSVTSGIPVIGSLVHGIEGMFIAGQAAGQVDQLTAAGRQWVQQGAQMVTNAGMLATKFGVSMPAAFALATEAGVNLNQSMARGSSAMQIAEQQIRNLETGLGAMGAPAGMIGNDMNAIAISSGLAATKVSQVTQAFDQLFGLVSGGIGDFSQLVQSVREMQNATASTSTNLSGSFTSISTGASNAKYSLSGLGQNAMQSLQQVGGALSTAEQEMNFFQNAMAAGAISSQGFVSATKDIVGLLAPFAQGNASVAASLSLLAQRGGLAGGSVKQLAAEAGIHGTAAMKALEAITNQTSVRLSNLNAVAQHLGVTMQSQMTAAFSKAVLNALHYNTALQNLANTMVKYPGDAAKIHAAQAQVNNIQREAAGVVSKFGADTAAATQHQLGLDNATKKLPPDLRAMQTATEKVAAGLVQHQLRAAQAAQATLGLNDKVTNLTSTEQGGSGTRDQVNTQLQKMQTQSAQTATAVFNLQSKVLSMSSASLTAAGKMLTLTASIMRAGTEATAVAAQVARLAASINALQSKTITLTTNMVTTNTHRAAGGPVAAGMPYTVGEMGPELFIPAQTGMILPASETRQFLSGGSGSYGSPGGGGGGTAGPAVAEVHSHVYLDGQEIWRNQQRQTLQYNVRNGNPQSGQMAPGRG